MKQITLKDFEEAIKKEKGTFHLNDGDEQAAANCFALAQKMVAENRVCKHRWFRTTKNYKSVKKCLDCGAIAHKQSPALSSPPSSQGQFSEDDMRKCFEAGSKMKLTSFASFKTFDDYLKIQSEKKTP